MSALSPRFRAAIDQLRSELVHIPRHMANRPWRAGGWTRKQVLGHMIDSATLNHLRVMRASSEGKFTGVGYEQERWLAAHNYKNQSWIMLLRWWEVSQELFEAVVDSLDEAALSIPCTIGDNPPVALGELIEDYLRHQYKHMEQLKSPYLGTAAAHSEDDKQTQKSPA